MEVIPYGKKIQLRAETEMIRAFKTLFGEYFRYKDLYRSLLDTQRASENVTENEASSRVSKGRREEKSL